MNEDLQRELSRVELGDHLCLLYEESEHVLPVAATFLRDALAEGGHAIYVVDDHSLEEVVSALEVAGVDVDAERGRGALRFLTAEEYCPAGRFEPQQMLARFRALGDEVASTGAPFVRAAVEMTWALTSGAPLDLLAEYESWGNHIFDDVSGASLCLYNRRRFPAAALERLLRAHPIVVVGEQVAPNPFYEPPEVLFRAESDPSLRFEWMLERLERARADRREREELAARAQTVEVEREARAAAEELNRDRSRFLAVLSHEIRTPLNAIVGYSELLREELAGPLTDEQRAHLERIDASIRHLLTLVDEVLDLSRAEAGEAELRLEEADAGALAREVLGLLRPQARERGLELVARIPDTPLPMETDAGRLRQILLNLLSNAVKFTDEGRVSLEVRAADQEVRFLVSDTGIGIDESELERIFDSFHQVELSGTAPRGGVGLGLAVSRSYARLLGGDVTAQSEPGMGSRFTVTLPVKSKVELQIA